MHEFGLAMRIVEVAREHARPLGPRKVTQIEVELGDLSGVMYESLRFSLEAVVQDSDCRGARILIHRIPGEGECLECGARFPLEALFGSCPTCGASHPRITRGKEFRLLAIEVD